MRSASTRGRLLWLQVSQGLAIQLIMSVFYPFLKQRFSFAELSIQSAIQYGVPLTILPFVRVFWIKKFILLALSVNAVRMLLLPSVDTLVEVYITAAAAGLMLVFFWVPYELMYFRENTAHGKSSAWYFGSMSLIGVVAPIMAGFVADYFGYQHLFWLAAVLMLMPIYVAARLPDTSVCENLFNSLKAMRGIRHLLFFDGFLLSATMCLTALSLLTLTKTALEFGAIGSVAAGMAVLISFPAARWSDAHRDRFAPIAWTSLVSAGLLLALGWQTSLWWFSLILIVYTSVRMVAQPIVNALPMDLRADHAKLYIARQFLLNAGRVLGFGLTWACVLTLGLKPMYLIYAATYLIYILCVRDVLHLKST